MMNPHKITAEFEKALCDYCGSPYAVAVDNCSNALFLALYYEVMINRALSKKFDGMPAFQRYHAIQLPSHTYPSVACAVKQIGARIEFMDNDYYNALQDIDNPKGTLTGAYQLSPTNVWDSALSFTANMYKAGQHMCLSFTGPFKHLKLGKGGAILTDDARAAYWFKRARFSGRRECSYHEDDFDETIIGFNEVGPLSIPPVVGWNFYMMPEIAARGLLLMAQFYDKDGKPKHNEDLCLPYPDLSKFKLWQ